MSDLREDLAGLGRRVFLMLSRGVIRKVDDGRKMQEMTVALFHDESKQGVERFQQYGFSSVPHEGAEVVVAHLGGARSHGVVLAADDRRHRPKDLKPGESVLYDDQGQQLKITRDGIEITSPKKMTFTFGPVTLTIDEAGIDIVGGHIRHDGKNIGSTHVHGGVETGPSNTTGPQP